MSDSWRILMLLFVPVGKGAYWRALYLARHLVERGHRVTLMAMSPVRRFGIEVREEAGVTIVETPDLLWGPLRSGWDPWDALNRLGWLGRREFDLVHLFDARPTALIPALYLQTRRHLPLVIDWEDWLGCGGSVEERPNPFIRTVLRPVETFFEERFRARGDAATVICTVLRDKAIALGARPERILLLRDGADLDGLHPLDRDTCRRELGLPIDAPILGYVGAVFFRDARLMAHAFDRVSTVLPAARLLLIGYVTLPVEKMVAVPAAVIRTGVVTRAALNRYLCACDVCWLPLRNSGANRGRWPMKLNDYMSVGRPTVATAVGDVTQVMREHEIGLLAEDTPDDLAHKAVMLLNDPPARAIFGHNARRVAEEVFDWRLRAAELEALYGQVMADLS